MSEKLKLERLNTEDRTSRIWFMVTDRKIGRVYSRHDGRLVPIAEMRPSFEVESDMSNKTLGRVAGSSGGGVRHKYEPHMNESQREEHEFVREISAWLDSEAEKGSFDKLVLASTPHMLGEFRKALKPRVHARIAIELNKDLTKMSKEDLCDELEKVLWF